MTMVSVLLALASVSESESRVRNKIESVENLGEFYSERCFAVPFRHRSDSRKAICNAMQMA